MSSGVTLFTHHNSVVIDSSNVNTVRLPFLPNTRELNSGWRLYYSFLKTLKYFIKSGYLTKMKSIHIAQVYPFGLLGLIFNKILDINYTIFILGEELSGVVYGEKNFKNRIIQSLYRLIIKNSSHVFAYSSFVRANINILFNGEPANVSLFSIGLEPEIFCSTKWKYHKNFCPENDEIILFSIARHVERKGFDMLIEAIKVLIEKAKNWHLYIGGQGPLTGFLKKKVIEYNLTNHVTFLGLLEDSELHGCYRRADIFILPNRMLESGDADGCPIVFLEASSYGVPCIGGRLHVSHDAIVDGVTGYVVYSMDVDLLSDKIAFLINNENKRKQMGVKARKIVETNYKWEDRINKFEEINDKISY